MNIQILPNWCKKLGLIIFLLSAVPSFIAGFHDGLKAGANTQEYNTIFQTNPETEKEHTTIKETKYINDNLLHISDIIALFGMIIYIISKEKIEDDYINKLRLDSYVLTVLILLCISLMVYIFSGNINVHLDLILSIFLTLYLVIFFFKKRIY
ncbi:hypothetical protein Q4566_05365 [Tamlana sp. 2_MG-2023]|uniref:hypothetical protein n=1 Tax=unclassified Tamlana TaxID=2614803 RepID=UPI0026E2F409|nr:MULTISPECIES: hypothetical protein [unclassified Tamlana]MDO6759623.1 hypothetical protein [Tamlana sp. 2_MG-2023]MDO6791246.1 hypothetical protein [Tamlana sp. 1_MG-2023]